jgi:hypothetical protein
MLYAALQQWRNPLMKNPWMSMWLSAANKATSASRGVWSAEAARQQQQFAKTMTKAMTDAIMPGTAKKPAPKRRGK